MFLSKMLASLFKKSRQSRDSRTKRAKMFNGLWILVKDYRNARSTDSILDNYSQYLDFEDIEQWLHYITEKYPALTKLEVIGQSVENRNLYGLTISEGDAETNGRESVFIGRAIDIGYIGYDIAFSFLISRMWNPCSGMDLSSCLSLFHLPVTCIIRRVSIKSHFAQPNIFRFPNYHLEDTLRKPMNLNQIAPYHIRNQILFRWQSSIGILFWK